MITFLLFLSILLNFILLVIIKLMAISHFGTFGPIATKTILKLFSIFRRKVSIVVYDIRKMHELNSVLGYTNSNILVARLTQIRRSRFDIIGQFGGDEFVIISTINSGKNIAERIIEKSKEITLLMTDKQRTDLFERTNGITNGINLAVVYCNYTKNAFDCANKCVDKTEIIKESGVKITGNRATTGNIGTLIAEL